jgi:uncharacterized hydrophobic protein (TIGR00271 family)
VLQLRVFGAAQVMTEVAERLSALPDARHITWTEARDRGGGALVTVDLGADAADPALEAIRGAGVQSADVELLRLESIQAGHPRRGASLIWADLLGQAGEHARPVARYLVFMAVAGVIAAYGVMYENGILIVGAMAVSPDLLPITAACVGLTLGRGRLVRRALITLAVGLGVAWMFAAALTALLDLVNLLPAGFALGKGSLLNGLTTVNSSTFVVAFVAGIAGMLALESRASAAVGVAISVTTIPASAYLGVAAGLGELGKASGALAVLGINVTMLVTGGTTALAVQRVLARRAATSAEI